MYKKIDLSNLPPEIGVDVAKELIDHRIGKKSPLTQSSFERLIKKAMKPNNIGLSPDEAIQETIDSGWQDINFNWLERKLGSGSALITKNRTIGQQLTDTSWAK